MEIRAGKVHRKGGRNKGPQHIDHTRHAGCRLEADFEKVHGMDSPSSALACSIDAEQSMAECMVTVVDTLVDGEDGLFVARKRRGTSSLIGSWMCRMVAHSRLKMQSSTPIYPVDGCSGQISRTCLEKLLT